MKSISTVLLFALVKTAVSFAQMENVGLPPIRNFSPKEYQSAAYNWSCIQDKRGILYVANENGLLEYDGGKWSAIPVAGDKSVRSLALDSAGRVFVGAINDIGYLDVDALGEKRFYSLRSLLPDTTMIFQEVWKTHVRQDEVIFHSDNVIFRYRKNHISIIPITSAQDYSFVLGGRLFVYQRDIGLSEIRGDTIVVLPGGNFYRDKRIRVILPYKKNTFLVGTENGLYLYDGKRPRRFATEADMIFAVAKIFSGEPLSGDQYVFATMGAGAVLLDNKGKLIHHIDKRHGLVSDLAFALCKDREQGVWIAQWGGISRVDFASPISIVDTRSGFDVPIFSLVRHRGRLYFGTADGIYKQNNTSKRNFFTIQPAVLRSEDVQALFSFEDGILAGCGEGTFFYHNGVARKISPAYAVSFNRSSRNPNLFYGADYSIRLLYYHNKRWIDKGSIPGIQESIRTCVENGDGSLWLFTYFGGIIHVSNHFHEFDRLKEPVITRYGPANGLPSLKSIFPVTIRGKLFFGTGQGLYAFDSLRHRFLFDSLIHSSFSPPLPRMSMEIFEEKNGDIRIAGQSQRWETEMFYYRRTPEGTYRSVPTSAGLLRKMDVSPLLHETTGVSWFASGDRLFRFDRGKANEETIPFETRIAVVKLIATDSAIYFGNPSTGSEISGREIQYSHNALRFEFSGVSYIGDENEFQYLLEGMDRSWSHWSAERYKEYSPLPPGDYRFRVRSKNAYGETGSEASFTFTILPPYWMTWWFRIGMVVLFAGAIVRIVKFIEQRKMKEKMRAMEKAAAVERERLRIARDLHDELGARLTEIGLMTEFARKEQKKKESAAQLRNIGSTTRDVVDSFREIVWAVNPQQDSLDSLVDFLEQYAQRFLNHAGIRCRFEIPAEIPGIPLSSDQRHGVFMAMKEVLNNIAKHARATDVKFSVSMGPKNITLTVEDNGCGFSEGHTHRFADGLVNMKKRIDDAGGEAQISSVPGKGTTVRFILPVS